LRELRDKQANREEGGNKKRTDGQKKQMDIEER
jgi:hypothetical protein